MKEGSIIINLFLTGDINVGKSTIINNFLSYVDSSQIGGFKTLPYYEKEQLLGYRIHDISKGFSDEGKFVGINILENGMKKCVGVTEAFENYGVNILRQARESLCKIVLMDELGFFEKDSLLFQSCVHDLLDSEKVVIGVIKKRELPFLNSIIEREDVEVIEITIENREEMYLKFRSKLEEII